ncbi:nitronate monooxygenase [Sinanaerobacter sp. ZZT-01]|uniref:NAD(P)H-dependent flavin oxidoreductase n=1 Tax=Sinanaerobacter sp. ZZT-01 TaxID=3111540 RepID=UPI002D771098|nr:nitronate monooxygenase [Sinanaerobacter sp. ZZT-01]WRR92098.1 nitronate monooxygenase [Sinanaerobacter sp. ZZT-01]
MFNWYGKGLRFGDLRIPTPIVQGGMGIGVSGRKLAIAVAESGGIGVISAVGLGYMGIPCEIEEKKDESSNISILRQEIRKAKLATKGVLGVNIMVAISEFAETARAAVEEGIDIIFAGAGLPLNLPAALIEGSKTKLVPIVSSARTAKLIAKRWMSHYQYVPDGFVVEGPMAGGHLGFSKEQIDDPSYRLENLIPQVLEEVKRIEEDAKKEIPIIAAGGVYTGEDIYEMLNLGASGVQMATRFVVTEECDADLAFKQAYIDCKKEDIGIIESPVGLPGRAIINKFLLDAKKGLKSPINCSRHCIKTCQEEKSPYCISSALINAVHGKVENGFAFIGANGYRVDRILTVAQLFEELAEEFRVRYEQKALK